MNFVSPRIIYNVDIAFEQYKNLYDTGRLNGLTPDNNIIIWEWPAGWRSDRVSIIITMSITAPYLNIYVVADQSIYDSPVADRRSIYHSVFFSGFARRAQSILYTAAAYRNRIQRETLYYWLLWNWPEYARGFFFSFFTRNCNNNNNNNNNM
jgi:hypothetical protein